MVALARVDHLAGEHTLRGRSVGQQFEQATRYGPRGVRAPVGAAAWNRGRESDIGGGGLVFGELDRGEMVGFSRIGHPVHDRAPSERGESDPHVVQRGTTTHDQICAVRIGRGQAPAPVRVEVQVVLAEPPQPWLGVVHRWGAAGQ